MKRIVLIDGENFLYGLRTLAGSPEKKSSRDKFITYPFRTLINEVIGEPFDSPMYYYGARLRLYKQDETLLKKSTKAIKFQLKLVNCLAKEKIAFIKAGYLRAREGEICPSCGRQEWKLLEKGVDVGLAVRMVAEAAKGVEIVLISSDTDLLPAVEAARAKGAKVMFVGYEYQPILALVKEADRTRTITATLVEKFMNQKDRVNGR